MIEKAKTILLLDDEKMLLELYRNSFEKHGYEVGTCTDVDDALSALRGGFDPDVILFDITMPDSKSGYEFIETVKREGLAKNALRVALTNEGQEAEQTRMKELGAHAHLLKAKYIPSEVVAKVEEMLQLKA